MNGAAERHGRLRPGVLLRCEAFLGTIAAGGTTVDGGTGYNINMNDSAGHEVSSGGLVTGTVIQCEYVGALP